MKSFCLMLAFAAIPVFAANRVFFIEPKDGAQVGQTVKIKFGLEGMKVAPLGDLTQNTGHHHLLINGKPFEKGQVIPTDEKHVHFGKGQTDAELKLPLGEHTLTMQFADGAHRSYGPEMSSTIKVKVK